MFKKIARMLLIFPKKILFTLAQNTKSKPKQKTVCVVRTDATGDFILFSQILPYFKKVYKDYKIILVGNSLWKELAEWICKNKILGDFGYDYFDEFFTIYERPFHRNFFYYYRTLKKLREISPEIVIQPTFSRTPKGDELVLIFKESIKVGYFGDLTNIKKEKKQENDKKYTRLIENSESTLETEKNKYFLNQLEGSSFQMSVGPEWQINENLLKDGREFLKNNNIDVLKPIIIISPGAGEHIRCWPVDNYILLMKKIAKKYPAVQFFVTGGKRDKEICDKIEKQTGNLLVYNFCGKIQLSELAKSMALSSLYIGNESGALHMALAVGLKTIALVGGGHYDRYPVWKTGPQNIAVICKMDCFNCNWKCIYKNEKGKAMPCIKNIKLNDVFIQIVKILG